MMKRVIEVSLINNSGLVLNINDTKLKHGRYTEEPNKLIEPGQSLTFKATKQTGAAYGVTGSFNIAAEGGGLYVFDFNNPYSGDNHASLVYNDTVNLSSHIEYNSKGQPMKITGDIPAMNFSKN